MHLRVSDVDGSPLVHDDHHPQKHQHDFCTNLRASSLPNIIPRAPLSWTDHVAVQVSANSSHIQSAPPFSRSLTRRVAMSMLPRLRSLLSGRAVHPARQFSASPSVSPAVRLARPLSQPTAFTHGNLMSASDVTPGISRAEYAQRRHILAMALPPKSLSIFPSNPQQYMSEDVPYLYHHNTDLMYICGITEPGSLLLAEKDDRGEVMYTLFVDERDASRELWDGPLCGADEEVRAYFDVDHVRTTEQLPTYIAQALQDIESLHFDRSINDTISASLAKLDSISHLQLVSKWKTDEAPKSFLLAQRLIKSEAEQQLMGQAGQIMGLSLNEAMAHATLSPETDSVDEKYIEALLEFGCKKRGSPRMAFPSVVASGANGTILHYMSNNRAAVRGDFVMVDAGCEVHGYSSDISRSWPVSGKFSGAQRDLYELVLSVQKTCITIASEDARFGDEPISLDRMHLYAIRELTDGLLQLGFMKGHSVQSAMSTGAYSRYFPHATGHYLGMDVHDTHQHPKSLNLRRNMVVTVEPGLYCPVHDTSVPPAFRGLGMRIEDDVIVGGSGKPAVVLSDDAVKEVSEVEALVGSAR